MWVMAKPVEGQGGVRPAQLSGKIFKVWLLSARDVFCMNVQNYLQNMLDTGSDGNEGTDDQLEARELIRKFWTTNEEEHTEMKMFIDYKC